MIIVDYKDKVVRTYILTMSHSELKLLLDFIEKNTDFITADHHSEIQYLYQKIVEDSDLDDIEVMDKGGG